ncbi:cysteine dioxygenase [Nocardia sp. NPDC052566]|uniref:cysteine dioxygenase n=1 Tax=Nocardia sp. NPDC052566 TaxID=3364330 RepID=UPI0037CC1055
MSISTAPATPVLADLVCAIREVVQLERSPAESARLVAERLECFLARPNLLPPEYREGDAGRYRQHLVHTEDDGSFSVVALVWMPGQQTPIHDHVAWCVAGVYEGAEAEQRYELRGAGSTARLVVAADVVNAAGTACGFAPPGDIHLVRNAGAGKVISIHIYGANIGKLGTSVRREYRLPIVAD